MPPKKVEPKNKYQEKLDKAKEVVKNNWKPFTVGVVFTGVTIVTVVVTKRVINPMSIPGIGTVVRAKSINNLYVIVAAKPTSLSYVVRCDQTGAVYRSQHQAAKQMGLHAPEISKQLNGAMDHVRGYTFTRLGIGV